MDLFDLAAKLTLNTTDYEKGLKKAEQDTESKASKIGKALKGAIGTVAKVGAAATVAAGTAIGKVLKDSVAAYAEYEQLVGGIKKLYGGATNTVLKYANEAYKTVGMSASQYMASTTAFTAKLVSDFAGDTAKAAEYADKAMRQIADNANTFGKFTVDDLTQVYQALARGSYMTLDNLSLGFSGTKQGMEDLLKEAQKITGIKYDIDNFNDIIDAIGVIQDSLNITGTTAKEATTTIQGSLSMTKAAWQNLLTGLASGDQDVNQLVENLVSSGTNLVNNLVPVIKTAMKSIGTAIGQLAPAVSNLLIGLVTEVAPDLVKSAVELVLELANALKDNAEPIIDAAFEIIDMLVDTLSDPNGLISLIDAAFEIVTELADGIIKNLPVLLPAVVDIIMQIINKLTDPESLNKLIGAAVDMIIALQEGLFEAMPILLEALPEIITNLVLVLIGELGQFVRLGVMLVMNFIDGIASWVNRLTEHGKEIIDKVWSGIKSKIDNAKQWGKDLIQNFINGILSKWNSLREKVSNIAGWFKGIFGHSHPTIGPMRDDYKWMPDMMELFTKGIEDNADMLQDAAASAFDLSGDFVAPDIVASDGYDSSTEEYVIESKADRKIDQLIDILSAYLPGLANMKVMLDSGALVGELAPGMDAALGRRAVYAARGMA